MFGKTLAPVQSTGVLLEALASFATPTTVLEEERRRWLVVSCDSWTGFKVPLLSFEARMMKMKERITRNSRSHTRITRGKIGNQ